MSALLNQNDHMHKGDTCDLAFTFTGMASLAGFSLRWDMSETRDGTALLTKSTENNSITIDGNIALVHMGKTDTDYAATNIPVGIYIHQLRLIDSQGLAQIVADGELTIMPTIYKP